jgi:hypothetical protein
MPGIGDVQVLSDAEGRRLEWLNAESICRRNPNGTMELRLSRPGEIGMGASTWGELRLVQGGHDVTAEHPLLADRFGMSLAAPDFYFPWDRTGTKLTVPLMGRDHAGNFVNRVAVYDLAERSTLCQLDDTWCSGIVWSPQADEMLLFRGEESELVTAAGNRRMLSVPSRLGDGVMGGWTPDGHHVALSPPLSDDKPEKLVFVESRSGQQVKECPLDPLELLPFDEVRFRDLATDRWMIDRDGDPNMRWSGNWYQPLMSHWASALYDGPASTLTLSAFRPTFELVPPPRAFRRLSASKPPSRPHSQRLSEDPPDEQVCVMCRAWVRVSIHN